jgi:hypothetical protein
MATVLTEKTRGKTKRVKAADECAFDDSARPFYEVVVEHGLRIPDEELAKLPSDGSINLILTDDGGPPAGQ